MIQRRAGEVLTCSLTLLIAFVIAGCGGGSSNNKVGPATTITITPNSASLDFGKFVTLAASAKDANGKTVDPATITWTSNNTSFATVTASGANGSVCAGTWDSLTTPTVCTAPQTSATAAVTITASSGSASATAIISVHPHIARLVVSPVTAACVSQTQTFQMNAQAFDSAGNVIPFAPGSFTWTVADSNIATVDTSGVVTAVRPGSAAINASISGTTGLPVPFVTCPPTSISFGTQNVSPLETAFALAPGATKTLAATATDINGTTLSNIALTYSSSNTSVATVTVSGSNAVVTAISPGTTTVVASCTPPSCNSGPNQPFFSNPVTVTVSGATAQKVVVTGTSANGVVIYDSSAGTSTAVAFPTRNGQVPSVNSLIISSDGKIASLGSDLGILRLDLNANSFLSTFDGSGVVRSVSPDGTKILATNGNGPVYLYNLSANTLQGFNVAGVTAADFSVDNFKAMMVAGSNTLYVFTNGASTLSQFPLSGTATDLKFSPQGSVALAAEGSGELLANCSNSAIAPISGNVGTVLAETNAANRMWGADGNNIYQVDISGSYASTSTSCAPQLSATSTPHSLPTSITPVQLVATPNGQLAYLVNNSATLYAASTSGVTPITLTGGGTPLSAGVSPDSTMVYVGASTGDLHRIDVGSNTDVQQIAIGLKKSDGSAALPNLIAVRTK